MKTPKIGSLEIAKIHCFNSACQKQTLLIVFHQYKCDTYTKYLANMHQYAVKSLHVTESSYVGRLQICLLHSN